MEEEGTKTTVSLSLLYLINLLGLVLLAMAVCTFGLTRGIPFWARLLLKDEYMTNHIVSTNCALRFVLYIVQSSAALLI